MGKEQTDFPLKEYYSDIHATYDRVNRVFTFGRDRHWRSRAARRCLEAAPESVLDLCTGTGDFAFEVARQSGGGVQVTGYDFSSEMLEEARTKQQKLAEKEGEAVRFIQGEVSGMPFGDGSFDAVGITFGLRNLVYENSLAGQHLGEIRRVLRQGGTLTVLESSNPSNGLWRIFNTLYLRLILPYLGGLLSGNLRAYRYLATSSRNYYSIPEMEKLLEEAGFSVVSAVPLFLGSVMLVTAVRR